MDKENNPMSNPSENKQPQKTKSLLDVDPNEIKGFGGSQFQAETTEDSLSDMEENAAKDNTELSNSQESSKDKNPNQSSWTM